MRITFIAAAATALLCAGQVNAQELVRIDFLPNTSAISAFTFEVERKSIPINFDFAGFKVIISNGSGRYAGVSSERFYVQGYEGGFGDYVSSQLFIGSTQNPVFSIGTYALISGSSGQNIGNVSIYPVPEPATWAMMILGVGLIGGAVRRRIPVRHSVAAI